MGSARPSRFNSYLPLAVYTPSRLGGSAMYEPALRNRQSLLEQYSEQLGSLLERRHTERALIAAKGQAERAARLAAQALHEAQEADRAKTKFLGNMTHMWTAPS